MQGRSEYNASTPTSFQQLAINLEFEEAVRRVRSTVAPLNLTGAGTPMFWVHSIGGRGTDPIRLAQELGGDRPFYSIRVPNALRTEAFAGSIADMAAHYRQELERVRPTGPVHLGAWSAGTVIALEMAQQLQASGRTVARLAVVDFAPAQSPDRAVPLLARAHSVFRRIKAARRPERPHPMDEPIRRWQSDEVEAGFVRTFHDAAERYAPRRYEGAVLLYVARNGAASISPFRRLIESGHMTAAWRSIAPVLTVAHMSGDHSSLMKGTDVVALAARLKSDLASADAYVPSPPVRRSVLAIARGGLLVPRPAR